MSRSARRAVCPRNRVPASRLLSLAQGSRFLSSSRSSKMISLLDCFTERSITRRRCGRSNGSKISTSHWCQLVSTHPVTCHEIARMAPRFGLHRRTTSMSSLTAKPAGDIPIERSYHEFNSVSGTRKKNGSKRLSLYLKAKPTHLFPGEHLPQDSHAPLPKPFERSLPFSD